MTSSRTAAAIATRQKILDAGRDLLREHPGTMFTLADVGARVGITRPAVLYHFSSKERLILEIAMGAIDAEADAAVVSVACAGSAADAIGRFIRGIVAFHTSDPDRFALLYLRTQVVGDLPADAAALSERRERLYPATGRMYAAVEGALRADPHLPPCVDARRLAVAAHLAALGFVTMAGTLAAFGESMKEPLDRYVDELVRTIGHGLTAADPVVQNVAE